MKKRFIMLAGVCMLAGVLSGCGSGVKSGSAETGAKNES
ncbi:MAG TPA: spermidine/putrescine ABC transporter substrate-binding protein, partial [Clostridium sp.]|nr:spermidine/putrescine ABC transporter substrate-binding protein [Clostridium sp.]